MRNLIILLVIALVVALTPGCVIVESLLSDVGGFDLTACEGNYDVCAELYFDNVDNIPVQP